MKFLKTFFAVVIANVALFVVVVGIAGIVVYASSNKKPDIDDGSYLVIDIYGDVLAYDPPESLPSKVFGGSPETLHRILENLEKAAVDDRIAGVVMKVSSNNSLGYAMIEEIRAAIDKVQEAGKPVYAHGEYMDRKVLFLASTCDSIFIPEIGEMWLTGMGLERSFVKNALDKLGIEPNIHRIKEYKSAAEIVLREDMSPESREMAGWMLDDFWNMQISAIAAGRGMTEDELVGHMETVLFTADEALEAGLVDGLAYWSDLKERLKGEDDEEFKGVTQGEYAKFERKDVGLKGDKKIAVIHAHGYIGGRESRVDPALGPMMGHQTVVSQFRAAAKDADVAAIVFRVDSGGGESLTGDIIGREVERTAREKPVIVSMVDVAASGGYSISYRATKMVADRMTVTGSIGSISGKFNTAAMWNKVGITFDAATKGPNALFWSAHYNFTDEQRERFEETHWAGVNHWMQDIADHRGMTFEEIEALAHGRVWTGRQAKANGLVDDVGGLDRAIEIAKEEAKIPADEEVTLEHFPKKKGMLAMITGGDSPTTIASWMLYRLIHHDLAQTLHAVTAGRLAVWDARVAN